MSGEYGSLKKANCEVKCFDKESFEDYVWDTDERTCFENKSNRCLPDAIQLSMSLQGASGEIVSDSQVINLCVRPCKPELFE